MINLERFPLLIAVSAPSGAGKTTLCDRLVAEYDTIIYSVSCTTRTPREGEVDGKSYFFLSDDEFDRRVKAGEFIEHATVHDHRYGTLKQTITDAFREGYDVLMDIDVQGAAQIREYLHAAPADDPMRLAYIDVFIAPPSIEDLQLRLWGRGKDERQVIQRRLIMAGEELKRWREYQYVIVNDRLDESYAALKSIVSAEHHRVRRTKTVR